MVTERTRICCVARHTDKRGGFRAPRASSGSPMEESKGAFKHSEKYKAMQAKYGAGGARDRERTSRRESPSATPQAGRSSRAAGTATAHTPGEKSRLLEKRDRRGGRGSKGGSRGGFNFCKVSDTPATSPAAIDENAA